MASFSILLPQQGLALHDQSVLAFALGDAADALPSPVDLTIEVVDRRGNAARLPLSHTAYLQPRIPARIAKAEGLSNLPPSEIVLQDFEYPLSAFVQANPAFDPMAITEVGLISDRTPAGTVVLDDLGFR